ncbi:hypothetical protein ABIB40_004253, partial [Pedobacter sp. UYP30]
MLIHFFLLCSSVNAQTIQSPKTLPAIIPDIMKIKLLLLFSIVLVNLQTKGQV